MEIEGLPDFFGDQSIFRYFVRFDFFTVFLFVVGRPKVQIVNDKKYQLSDQACR